MDKALKQHIVSFRISDEQAELIKRSLANGPILGVKSINQFFRKTGLDVTYGRVTYKDPECAARDMDLF